MTVEKIVMNRERNVEMEVYLQGMRGEFDFIPRRPAIIVLPGGGYEFCSDREGEALVGPYLKAGFQVFVLYYSVLEHATWPNPLDDFERAMELIKKNSEKWRVHTEKIAVLGFSAGGHLAACAATMAKHRPNAALLGYALTKGEDIGFYNSTMPDAVEAVSRKTAPCFLFSSAADHVVPIDNSLCFMQALARNRVTFESHIYACGPHGFSTGDSCVYNGGTPYCLRTSHWVEDSISWLRDLFGDFKVGGYTEARCRKTLDDDRCAFLSLDCTLGHLMQCEETGELIAPILDKIESLDKGNKERRMHFSAVAPRLTLREIMECAQASEQDMSCLDQDLRKIPNR